MGLQFFNTLSRTIEPFVSDDAAGRRVGMYCCGPTVYDFGHIGNFRTFVFGDLVRRYLGFHGYDVVHVLNITDVEDKIIRRVGETGSTLAEYTRKYEAAFLEDLATLSCLTPDHLPRATEHIPEIIELIRRLMDRGLAYKASDGSVYFSIDRYQKAERWPGCACRYGQLVQLNMDAQRQTERVASDEYTKDNVADFALWKAYVPTDGEVSWDSPWGKGRPGWHIECSAMSMKLLGDTFDIHLGGEDLAFPHHEDEIAQSEGAGGLHGDIWNRQRPFVKYWMHAAHLLVEGKKMSKSLGNFFTLRDLVDKGWSGREIRFLLLSASYRETFNFTLEGLDGARSALARIDECVGKLREKAGAVAVPTIGSQKGKPSGINGEFLAAFQEALDDDLNVSRGWAAVFDWIREINKSMAAGALDASTAAEAVGAWETVDTVMGMGRPPEAKIPDEILALLEARTIAKREKDFRRSDAVRDELRAKGWVVEDTPKGPKVKPLIG